MAGAVASLVVQFGSEEAAQYMLQAEVDGRDASDGGLNKGKTNFIPGDEVYFLVYKSTELGTPVLSHTLPSPGTVTSAGSGSIEVDEFVTFANATEASLPHPANNGAVSISLMPGSTAPGLKQLGDKLVTSEPALAVVRVTYTSNYLAYRISGVPETLDGHTSFPVVIMILCDLAANEEEA